MGKFREFLQWIVRVSCENIFGAILQITFPIIGIGAGFMDLIPWNYIMVSGCFFIPVITCLMYLISRINKLLIIKGKLVYSAFGIFHSTIDPENTSEVEVYFKAIICNCSYSKIFFKISDKSQFRIHNRTNHLNDEYFKNLVDSTNFILPYQNFTIPFPLIKVPSTEETLPGLLNIIFNYGESPDFLPYTAEFEISCEIGKGHCIDDNEDDNEYKIMNWFIEKAEI